MIKMQISWADNIQEGVKEIGCKYWFGSKYILKPNYELV
jgi:hypothetical protein